MGQARKHYQESKSRFTEGESVFIVTGRNNTMNSVCLYAFTSREAAELWANDDALNDNDDWVINEVPLRRLAHRPSEVDAQFDRVAAKYGEALSGLAK